MYKSSLCLLIILMLSSCGLIHRSEIEQGNVIHTDMLSHLHKGMTPNEVIAVMGTPVLVNIFSPNRIDYVYTIQDGGAPRQETRLTCLFKNGRLVEMNKLNT